MNLIKKPPIWRLRTGLAAKWQNFVQCYVTSPLVRLGSYTLFYIDNFYALFKLSGFSYKTFFNVAIDAAKSVRSRHIGDFFSKKINKDYSKAFFNSFVNIFTNMAYAESLGGVCGCVKKKFRSS